MSDELPPLPPSCTKGSPSPWSAVFTALIREAGRKGRTQASIAREYGVLPKEITRWMGVSDAESRCAPLWVIRRLSYELGYAVVILPESVFLVPIERVRALES